MWVQGARDYTASEIKDALEKVAPVEDVVVRTSNKRKGSALAVMVSADGAQAAIGSISGLPSSPLLVVPYQTKVGVIALGVSMLCRVPWPRHCNK